MNENKENQTSGQVQNTEKLDGDSISLTGKSKLLSRLDNFWFHYKWPVIIGAFFLIVFIIGLVQILGRTDNDAAVAFAGPAYISPNDCAAIENELSKILPEDYTGDGKKIVKFSSFTVYYENDLEGKDTSSIDLSQNSTNKGNYEDYVSSGECSIYFVGKNFYDNFVTHNRVQSMSDIFGENLPEGITADGYGVRLGDLPIYQLDAFRVMPEDTYVCLTRPYIYGESSKEDRYAEAVEVYKAIINFGQ